MNVAAPRTIDPKQVLDQAIASLKIPGGELPIGDVERALQVAPNDPRLWHIKGLIHRELDHRELAIPALRRAASLAPAEPLIAHGLARALLEAGLPSVVEFGRAMKLNRGDPEVVRGMIAALAADGRVDDAIAGLEAALTNSPLWTDGHKLLAQLRWAKGERQDFVRSFDAAIAANPASLELRRELLILLIHAEQWEAALERIEKGREQVGEHALFVSFEAFIRSEMGDIEAADRLFAMLPENTVADIDLRRVRHLLRSGRAVEATRVLDEWLEKPEQLIFWPYAPTAWRLTGDDRWQWLEGDDRFVGIYDIADRLPPLDELAVKLRELHAARGQLLAQSVRGGTQTDGNLFHRIEPIIVKVREVLREVVAEHAARLPPEDPRHPLLSSNRGQVRFTGAWSVRLLAGGHHANHVHPFGWLSSALYIVLPPDLGQEQAGWFALGEPPAELQTGLPPTRVIEPKPGRLVLFPGWMWHGTRPFNEGERMTIAFDVAR